MANIDGQFLTKTAKIPYLSGPHIVPAIAHIREYPLSSPGRYIFISIYHKIQIMIKQDSYTKANVSGEETQKRNHGAYRYWAPSQNSTE